MINLQRAERFLEDSRQKCRGPISEAAALADALDAAEQRGREEPAQLLAELALGNEKDYPPEVVIDKVVAYFKHHPHKGLK